MAKNVYFLFFEFSYKTLNTWNEREGINTPKMKLKYNKTFTLKTKVLVHPTKNISRIKKRANEGERPK